MSKDVAIDRAEITKLLNIKFEKLGKIDFVEDLEPLSEPPSDQKKTADLLKFLRGVPDSPEGNKTLSELPFVKKIDSDIARKPRHIPNGNPLHTKLTQIPITSRTELYKSGMLNQYNAAVELVGGLYSRISRGGRVRSSEVQGLVQDFLEIFMKDRCILLNIANQPYEDKDYLYKHALNVSLLAINIAAACGYSEKQALEIGQAGLLADIGMTQIPEKIRFKPDRLSRHEFLDIQKHTIISLSMIENILNVPSSVLAVAYQHHERNSGTGYIKQRKSHLIHDYAKIIAIADVFNAISNDRAHRKGLSPHQAMTQIVRMSKVNLLEADFVMKFIQYTSLYPIGSYVILSNNKMAKVVQNNFLYPTRPIVSVLADPQSSLHGKKTFQIDLAMDKSGLHISKALNVRVPEGKLMLGL